MNSMRRNLLLASCSALLLWGCSTHLPSSRSQKHQALTAQAKEGVRSYLMAQMDKETPEMLQERQRNLLSSLPLRVGHLEEAREELWQLWREANEKRMQDNQFTSLCQAPQEVIWDLPEGERMKIALFCKGNKPSRGYALYINLHGGGKDPSASSPWGAAFNDREWAAARSLGQAYKDTGSLYYVPRMADDRKGRWYLAPQRVAFRRAWQLAVLSGEVDPDRIYLMGISEGGYGSHRLALYMPDYFAGIGPMAAAEPLKAAENLRNVAFRLSVGEHDRGFGRNKLAQAWKEELARLAQQNPGDFVHEVYIQPAMGHGINYYPTAPWLERHSRRNYPKRVSYKYHNMTHDYAAASYSAGVYYLDFRQIRRASDASSISLDVHRSGNTLSVTTHEGNGVSGELRLYLDEIDYKQPIVVQLNGVEVVRKRIEPSWDALVESLMLWGDPRRLYGSYVEITLP